MPKGRMLNKKIIQDEKVAKLSLPACLLYTWCIPFLDVEGRMYGDVWTLKSIAPHVKEITPENIPSIIKEWAKNSLVISYGDDVHKYLQFIGFWKNQSVNKDREAPSEIPTPEQLKSNSGVTPDELLAKLSKDNIIQEQSLPIEEALKKQLADFEECWQAYPKKLGRKQAEKHWKAYIKSGHTKEQVLKAIENYKSYIKDHNVADQYVKHGSTFFNNFEDYLTYEPQKPKERCDF